VLCDVPLCSMTHAEARVNSIEHTPKYARIRETCHRFGLNRTRLYHLAGKGRVRFVKEGKATLVDQDSVSDYLAGCPPAQVGTPRAPDGCLHIGGAADRLTEADNLSPRDRITSGPKCARGPPLPSRRRPQKPSGEPRQRDDRLRRPRAASASRRATAED
jgi:hypothetical protein